MRDAGDELAGEVRVRRIDAGVEDRDGRAAGRADGAEGLVPPDQRQRPLVGVLGVGRGRARVAGRVCIDPHDAGSARSVATAAEEADDATLIAWRRRTGIVSPAVAPEAAMAAACSLGVEPAVNATM